MLWRLQTILASAALLSLTLESITATKNPPTGLQQTTPNPKRLTPVQIGSTNEKLSTTTETKKFFLSKTLTKDADRSAALKSTVKKNQYVGATVSKSKGFNKTSNKDQVLRLPNLDGIDASDSAPSPSLVKLSASIQKPKVNKSPKAVLENRFEDIQGSNSTGGTPERDMKASGSVLIGMKARQLFDPKSSYYRRPIYDYSDHGSLPIVHDKIYDFNKAKDHYNSDDRYKFTNGHSLPSKSYGHEQSYDDGYVSKTGEQGDDGYDQTAGHEDGSYGHHEDAAVQGGQSAGGEEISSHADDYGYGGHSLGGDEKESGHDKGEKGYVSKGHVDEGFDTLHRKVEYGFSETFGDDDDFEVYDIEHDSGDSYHDLAEGGGYQGHDVEEGEHYDSHGEAGSKDDFNFDEKFASIKASVADELNFDDHDSFGNEGSSYDSSHNSHLGFNRPHGVKNFYGSNPHEIQKRTFGFPHSGVFDSIDRGFKGGLNYAPQISSPGSQRGTFGSDFGGDSGPGSLGLYGVRDPLFRGDIG